MAFWNSPEMEASSMCIVCKVMMPIVITRSREVGSRAKKEESLVQEGTKEGTVELEEKQRV